MKIRFGANDVIDTKTGGGAAPENYEEVENAALDTQAALDDDEGEWENQTQLNYMKRVVRAFLHYLANGSGQYSTLQDFVLNEFKQDGVLGSKAAANDLQEIADVIVYGYKPEEGE